MKNYNVKDVLRDLGSAITVNDNIIIVNKEIGIHQWGKLDFLKRSGYTLVSRIGK